jgi:hypothetical protein
MGVKSLDLQTVQKTGPIATTLQQEATILKIPLSLHQLARTLVMAFLQETLELALAT